MGIKDFLERLRNSRLKQKEFNEDMKVQETYLERKKSANERELERYQNEQREKNIKVELEKWRAHRKNDIENNHRILETKNMYENEEKVVLKEKKLFSGKSNLNTRGGLFFK
jgi:hypothetical protein